jgi:hypothetical protein
VIDLTEEEEKARELGRRLLDGSGAYENFLIPSRVGFLRLNPFPPHSRAIAGLVGRQRRFLQATHTLADAGLGFEAVAMLRSMFEFLVRQLWLAQDPDHNWKLWMQDDHHHRDLWRERLRQRAPVLHDAAAAALTPDQIKEGANVQIAREQLDADLGRRQRLPRLEDMAEAVGFGFWYDGIYRFESAAVVHPMMIGVDMFLEPVHGGLVLRSEPTKQFPPVNVYLNGAIFLSRALEAAGDRMPPLRPANVLDEVNGALLSIVERRAEDRMPNWREVLRHEAVDES